MDHLPTHLQFKNETCKCQNSKFDSVCIVSCDVPAKTDVCLFFSFGLETCLEWASEKTNHHLTVTLGILTHKIKAVIQIIVMHLNGAKVAI